MTWCVCVSDLVKLLSFGPIFRSPNGWSVSPIPFDGLVSNFGTLTGGLCSRRVELTTSVYFSQLSNTRFLMGSNRSDSLRRRASGLEGLYAYTMCIHSGSNQSQVRGGSIYQLRLARSSLNHNLHRKVSSRGGAVTGLDF